MSWVITETFDRFSMSTTVEEVEAKNLRQHLANLKEDELAIFCNANPDDEEEEEWVRKSVEEAPIEEVEDGCEVLEEEEVNYIFGPTKEKAAVAYLNFKISRNDY